MNKTGLKILIVALIIITLVVGYFAISYRLDYPPRSGKMEVEEKLIVKYLSEDLPIDPFADVWNRVSPVEVHLYPQSARAPHGVSEKKLMVKGLYNDEKISFLVEFDDETENRTLPMNPDACAILFTPGEGPVARQMMGYGGSANVWYWLADKDLKRYQQGDETINVVRELIASGPGTQTPMKEQYVQGQGLYRNGKWSVVFQRQLASRQGDEFDFKTGSDQKIAFALWDGEKMESFARKSIAILRALVLEIK